MTNGPSCLQDAVYIKLRKLLLVHGRTHNEIGDASYVGQIVHPVMCRTIGPNQSTSVEAEHDMQVLDGHVVDDLVVRPLHERGVDVAEGHQAAVAMPA